MVPGGGPSLNGTRWIACRPSFFLPVRVLSRLFRRLFLHGLQDAFDACKLRFFGDLADLQSNASLLGHGYIIPVEMGAKSDLTSSTQCRRKSECSDEPLNGYATAAVKMSPILLARGSMHAAEW